jgi:secreted trypsin-like serine protease
MKLLLVFTVLVLIQVGEFEHVSETSSGQQINISEGITRIIGGTEAELGQFPYFVELEVRDIFFCGGSLIKPDWVLTVKQNNKSIRWFQSNTFL